MIGMNVFYIVSGMAAGGLLGACMTPFNKWTTVTEKNKNRVKFVLMLFIAVGMPVFCQWSAFQESKYIAIIFFGFTAF
jgi:hypothetical protein